MEISGSPAPSSCGQLCSLSPEGNGEEIRRGDKDKHSSLPRHYQKNCSSIQKPTRRTREERDPGIWSETQLLWASLHGRREEQSTPRNTSVVVRRKGNGNASGLPRAHTRKARAAAAICHARFCFPEDTVEFSVLGLRPHAAQLLLMAAQAPGVIADLFRAQTAVSIQHLKWNV